MPNSLSLRFASERFDYRSELPETFNAGNRFYGRDVAEWLAQGLTTAGIAATFFDEDWGWLVTAALGAQAPFEIAVYNLAEHGEGGRPGVGEWGLWVKAYERRKWLGILAKNVEVPVSGRLDGAVRSVFGEAGIALDTWPDGPG